MQTKLKIHLVRPVPGLTFCRAPAKGNVTRKLDNVTCKNCLNAYNKHEMVMSMLEQDWSLNIWKKALS